MKFIALIMLSCLLTGCAFTRDYVGIEYKPYSMPQRIVGAENVEVSVNVNEVRVKENIGYKVNGYGMEMANIMANNDVAEVFKNAIIWELQQRGFIITYDGSNLNIELCKFFNDFKPGLFSGSANSETVLNVILKKKRHGCLRQNHFRFWERGNLFSCRREKCISGIRKITLSCCTKANE